MLCLFFCFDQETAYLMRVCDWSSVVCCSDLTAIWSASTPPRNASTRRCGLMGVRCRRWPRSTICTGTADDGLVAARRVARHRYGAIPVGPEIGRAHV